MVSGGSRAAGWGISLDRHNNSQNLDAELHCLVRLTRSDSSEGSCRQSKTNRKLGCRSHPRTLQRLVRQGTYLGERGLSAQYIELRSGARFGAGIGQSQCFLGVFHDFLL